MSLKIFVSLPEVKARLTAEFPTPPRPAKPPLRAPPIAKNPSLIGTAFDYLLRFFIQRLNPCSWADMWVAEEAALAEIGIGDEIISLEEFVEKAKNQHGEYLQSGIVTDELLSSVLSLAQLDLFRRNPDLAFEPAYIDTLGKFDPLDISDLKQLLSLVNPDTFRARTTCLLNPRFGAASDLVAGADCDLVIDNTLIDIKTVKQFSLARGYLNQLLGTFSLRKSAKSAARPLVTRSTNSAFTSPASAISGPATLSKRLRNPALPISPRGLSSKPENAEIWISPSSAWPIRAHVQAKTLIKSIHCRSANRM